MKYDFHEHTLDQAIEKAHSMVGNARLLGRDFDAEFIVGHGIIKTELMSLLRNYGFSPTIKLGNSGVILCHIE